MNEIAEDILMHYGVKRRSGRYPWGSGDNPYQHSGDFLARVEELEKQGLSQRDIATAVGLDSTTELRTFRRVAAHERRELERARALSLREEGKNNSEIARIMGYKSESSIRSLLDEQTAANKNAARSTADILKAECDAKGMIDIGKGVERELGVTTTKMQEARFLLEAEGYNVYGVAVPQATNPGKRTTITVLAKPDISYGYAMQNKDEIKSVMDYHSRDGGQTYQKLQYPASIDSKRVRIRYGDEGGLAKDGVIEIRRGAKDLNLGNSHYAQVRILVDGTHYLKGMAMYSDDLPDGVDIVFNTNKKSGTPKTDVMKPIKHDDPNNPFGAMIKAKGQSTYIDIDGKEKLSAINKIKEEGDWNEMDKNLSSQFLSKQPYKLIKQQLDLSYEQRESQFKEIMSLTNPTVRQKLLQDFADDCDGASVHLKAAALPRQRTQVILPVEKLRDTEIYAPNWNDGEQVALIRYPHAGTFEIPVLTVNNRNRAAKSVLGNDILDAVGINPKVAERLSGADFDGDTVVVIPVNNKVQIKSTPYLDGLRGFEPKTEYAYREGMRVMKKSEVQKEMGMISNLITDMTLRGAPESDLVKAVKHSMVVIDAQKHKLDYKRSEIDNDIATLKKTWQSRTLEDGTEKVGGASTLLSRRKQNVYVPERQGSGVIDKETGKITYKESGRTYYKNGKEILAEEKVPLMSTVDDARKLSSGHVTENAYADYANSLKALANSARKEMVNTKGIARNSSAASTYEHEVVSLESKLKLAATNAPRERLAQIMANSKLKAQLQDNPELFGPAYKKERKKLAQMALIDARNEVGAKGKDTKIDITEREWEAIQAGAISHTKLKEILNYADMDKVRQYAMPKTVAKLNDAQIARIKALSATGYTNAEIARSLGISESTVHNHLGGTGEVNT